MKTYRKQLQKRRRGMITLDYILVLGVTLPVAWLLFRWLRFTLIEIYSFATVVINWPYL